MQYLFNVRFVPTISSRYRALQVVSLFLIKFYSLCFLRICLFPPSCQMYWFKVLQNTLINPLIYVGLMVIPPLLIVDAGNLCTYYFFLVNPTKGFISFIYLFNKAAPFTIDLWSKLIWLLKWLQRQERNIYFKWGWKQNKTPSLLCWRNKANPQIYFA